MANVNGVPVGQFNRLPPSQQTSVMQGVAPIVSPPPVHPPAPHPVVGQPAVAVPRVPSSPAAPAAPVLQSQPQAVAAQQLSQLDRIAGLVSPHFAAMASSVDRSNPLQAWSMLSNAFTEAARSAGFQQPEQFVAHLHQQADYAAGHQAAQQLVSRSQTGAPQAG